MRLGYYPSLFQCVKLNGPPLGILAECHVRFAINELKGLICEAASGKLLEKREMRPSLISASRIGGMPL